jgi:hypothetical protein
VHGERLLTIALYAEAHGDQRLIQPKQLRCGIRWSTVQPRLRARVPGSARMSERGHHGRTRRRGVALAVLLAASACFSETSLDEGGDASAADTGPASTGTSMLDSSGEQDSTEADATSGGLDTSDTDAGETSLVVTGGSEESSGASSGSVDDGSSGDASSTGELAVGVDALVPGDLVITEVMWNPNCGGDSCEWIEILNATASTVNILDLYVRDSENTVANQGRITDDIFVEAGALVVITRGVGDWPYMFEAAAVYGPNPGLNNGRPDSVSIQNEVGILDETASFPFDEDEGIAWSLSGSTLDAISNDSALNWCLATTVLPTDLTTEFGTPLETNPACSP